MLGKDFQGLAPTLSEFATEVGYNEFQIPTDTPLLGFAYLTVFARSVAASSYQAHHKSTQCLPGAN